MSWETRGDKTERWKREVERAIAAGEPWAQVGGVCGAETRKHNRDAGNTANERCELPAGQGTAHLGTGKCLAHGGTSKRESTRGAWVVAHDMARALNVTPWEALLGEVRRTAGTVAWLDRKVAEAPDDDALLRVHDDVDVDSGEVLRRGYRRWVDMRLEERRHLARVSKMAIDAGVAQQLVNQFALQGETVARLLTEVTARLGLSAEQEEAADQVLRDVLLKLEATATESLAIEGEIVEMRKR